MDKIFETREAWLMAAIEFMSDMFFEKTGRELPEKIRISTGWTKRARKNAIGWTWISGVTEDQVNNVFISPEIENSVEVLAVTLHELCHVADDCEHGHTGAFRQMWSALGFVGKPTTSVPGDELRDYFKAMVCSIGEYPHARMLVGAGSRGSIPRKQSTRTLKIVCEASGGDYKVRMTRLNIDKYGLPSCPCHGEEMTEVGA